MLINSWKKRFKIWQESSIIDNDSAEGVEMEVNKALNTSLSFSSSKGFMIKSIAPNCRRTEITSFWARPERIITLDSGSFSIMCLRISIPVILGSIISRKIRSYLISFILSRNSIPDPNDATTL